MDSQAVLDHLVPLDSPDEQVSLVARVQLVYVASQDQEVAQAYLALPVHQVDQVV